MHPLWQSGKQAAAEAASELCRTLAKFPLGNRARAPAQWLSGGGPQPPRTLTAPEPGPEPTNESNFAKTWTFAPPVLLVLSTRPGLLAWPWNSTSEFLSRRKRRPRSGRQPTLVPCQPGYRAVKPNLMEFSRFRMMTTTTREMCPHSPKEPRRMKVCHPPPPPLLTRTPPWLCTTPSSSPLSGPGLPRADFLLWRAIHCRILSVKESTHCQKMP